MANELQQAIRVNQKLAFARILLRAATDLGDDSSIPARQSLHAFLDSAIMQLHDAMSFFLIEIAAQSQASIDVDRYTLEIIIQQLQEQGSSNPLVREVEQLLTRNSWLSNLAKAKQNPQWLHEELAQYFMSEQSSANAAELKNNATIIPLVNIDQSKITSPLVQITQWLQDLQALIERHRNLIIED